MDDVNNNNSGEVRFGVELDTKLDLLSGQSNISKPEFVGDGHVHFKGEKSAPAAERSTKHQSPVDGGGKAGGLPG